MEVSKIYIDHQSDPGRNLKHRVRVQFGTGSNREDFDAAYYRTREEAEKARIVLRRIFNKIHKREIQQSQKEIKS